jgi:hypothetical protein
MIRVHLLISGLAAHITDHHESLVTYELIT